MWEHQRGRKERERGRLEGGIWNRAERRTSGSEYVKVEEDGLDDKGMLLLGEWLGECTHDFLHIYERVYCECAVSVLLDFNSIVDDLIHNGHQTRLCPSIEAGSVHQAPRADVGGMQDS